MKEKYGMAELTHLVTCNLETCETKEYDYHIGYRIQFIGTKTALTVSFALGFH